MNFYLTGLLARTAGQSGPVSLSTRRRQTPQVGTLSRRSQQLYARAGSILAARRRRRFPIRACRAKAPTRSEQCPQQYSAAIEGAW